MSLYVIEKGFQAKSLGIAHDLEIVSALAYQHTTINPTDNNPIELKGPKPQGAKAISFRVIEFGMVAHCKNDCFEGLVAHEGELIIYADAYLQGNDADAIFQKIAEKTNRSADHLKATLRDHHSMTAKGLAKITDHLYMPIADGMVVREASTGDVLYDWGVRKELS